MTVRSTLATVFLGCAFATATAAPAFAHSSIIDTTPASGKSVDSVTEVSITANEKLLDIGGNATGFVLAVRREDGAWVGDGCVDVSGDTATTTVTLSDPGTYTVVYRIVSNDGHPIEGKFSFDFAGTDETVDATPAYANRPQCGVAQEPISDATAPVDEPTEAPAPGVPAEPASPNDMGVIPYVGLATIPIIVGAIWLFVRTLGKRDSEDVD